METQVRQLLNATVLADVAQISSAGGSLEVVDRFKYLLRITDTVRFADLSAAIFALGMHQEPKKDTQYPFYMCELRRRAFWMAYTLDKSMATFFGRPPMINGKYCSCKLPVDMEEQQTALSGVALENLQRRLDVEGWSPGSEVTRLTWLRGTIINLRVREDILELSLGSNIGDLETRAE